MCCKCNNVYNKYNIIVNTTYYICCVYRLCKTSWPCYHLECTWRATAGDVFEVISLDRTDGHTWMRPVSWIQRKVIQMYTPYYWLVDSISCQTSKHPDHQRWILSLPRWNQCCPVLMLLDQADRIYNIDESWTGSKDDQWRSKVISREECSLYVVGDTERPHNSHSLLSYVPTDHSCQRCLPLPNQFQEQISFWHRVQLIACITPLNLATLIAFYSCSTYCTLSSIYLERPVVIFQDNLYAHDTPELVEFCVSKGIHLVNFPAHVTHILQPLNKLFGNLKTTIQAKAREASLLSQIGISLAKIPILLRLAIQSFKVGTVKCSFVETPYPTIFWLRMIQYIVFLFVLLEI